MVVRPRALPLLTPVETTDGTRHVWTTFSADQIDLNYANPNVLIAIIDLLLFYIEQGAEIIRLDAIAYLWKEVGTPSIHLPQTHHVVKLFRAVLDAVAPGVILITETNVPHEENISYFGEPLNENSSSVPRGNEAQMVYQFSLAPLVLHTFYTGDSRALTEWAGSLEAPFPTATFFNFIASHDGIGVRPAEGLLSQSEIQALADHTIDHGGQVSYKTNSDGTESAYELNITLFDALNNPSRPHPITDTRRFLASQAIMLSLAGVPGIYIHSLFGSRNCYSCFEQTGRARSLNRAKFQLSSLEAALSDPESSASQVFSGYKQMLRARREHPAFHPHGPQRVFFIGNQVFSVLRSPPSGDRKVLCLVNVAPENITVDLTPITAVLGHPQTWTDLITNSLFDTQVEQPNLSMEGYQYLWLTPNEN
jgi:sucrose phosphorylase